MSDKMRPLSFAKLVTWIKSEYLTRGEIFGIRKSKIYRSTESHKLKIFGEEISTPLGPAAGPHTQLTQNIVSAYLAGSRFIELKTVQIIDGEDLPVSKPCIYAQDEGYNVEWSTELRVLDAFSEYVKAWFILHILMKELKLSKTKDFIFNMSVGYDMKGIKSNKIDAFIEGLKDASKTPIWQECIAYLEDNIAMFTNFTLEDLGRISPNICRSITLSTLHGCPSDEIEQIVNYLLTEKGLHTFIKMNPTLLGERYVKDTLTVMGYDYLKLNPHHFKNDLQYDDGVKMLKRLRSLARANNLEVGVKLTNTLPVKIINDELPGEEMYLSGRALYPLTIKLAEMLSDEFSGKLKISYSGGIDFNNIDKVFETGIKPITFATVLLKPGGYEKVWQMAKKIESLVNDTDIIDVKRLSDLAKTAINDKHHIKAGKKHKPKQKTSLPLFNCQVAPCNKGCPIAQDISEYLYLVGEEEYEQAFKVIIKDNTAPFITGTICTHKCQDNCTRLDYDSSVQIRAMKKLAAENAEKDYLEKITPPELRSKKKVVVIGSGPAGISCSLFLRRNGIDVTVMEKEAKPYGTVQHIIPEFRIANKAIHYDYQLAKNTGVNFNFNIDPDFKIKNLQEEYDYVVLAIGAEKANQLVLPGTGKIIYARDFLRSFKQNANLELGKNICVIGGGDVAIDAARAAKRIDSASQVAIIYRRTKALMKASVEEITHADNEGVIINELLNPISFNNGILQCEVMYLGEIDDSDRRKPLKTSKVISLPCDTLIIAIGEHVDDHILLENDIKLNERNYPLVNDKYETNIANVYVAGDMKQGPKTVVEAIADGKKIAQAILNKENLTSDIKATDFTPQKAPYYERKGLINTVLSDENEAKRCLGCNYVCELCVDVCPNRANIQIKVDNTVQILHIDSMCNECGNCQVFCPHSGKPYRDKFTLFANEADFNDSSNKGFVILNEFVKLRLEDKSVIELKPNENHDPDEKVAKMIKTIVNDYKYLL